ncbi:XRE family transcriptional regulator [Mycobacteroides abscessus]|nr:XRE family transcriptional regulator [Mycobacteroides abscessus]
MPAGMIFSMSSVSAATARTPAAGVALRQARRDKDMRQAQVVAALIRLAPKHGITTPARATLIQLLSRWENGHAVPSPEYRTLLRHVYGRTDVELGFTAESTDSDGGHTDALTEIQARLARSQGVDGALLEALNAHTHQLRLLDRRLGAAAVLDQISAHIGVVRDLMAHTVLSRDRHALAAIVADAAALAGWQALDTGAVMRAWQHYDLARSTGREANEPAVYAHALGEQSYALADMGHHDQALALIEEAQAVPLLPPLMRCWLTAAHAEMHAYLGDGDGARRGFDQAHALLPEHHDDPTMPYLSLNTTHLTRWRGHGLAILGEPEAITFLTEALDAHSPEFVRAKCGLHADMATALHVIGERAEARTHALAAKQLAVQIGSERNRRRVSPLTGPV